MTESFQVPQTKVTSSGSRSRLAIPLVVFILGLAVVYAPSQTLESTVFLPDSCGGLRWPSTLCLDIPGNRLFVAGDLDDRILVIDCQTNERAGYIEAGFSYTPVICYNSANHELYCCDGAGDYTVIATDSSRVIWRFYGDGRLASDIRRFFCDSASNRVYCLTEDDSVVGVIDGRTDSVYVTQFAGQPARISWYDSITRKWPGYDCATLDVDSAVIRSGRPAWPRPAWSNPRTDRTYQLDSRYGHYLVVTQTGNSREVARIPVNFNSSGCYSPKHDRIYCPDHDQLAVVDLAARRVASLVTVGGDLKSACYCATHDRVYLADTSSHIVVFDPKANRVARRIKMNGRPGRLLYDGTLDRLWCTVGGTYLTAVDCSADTVLAEVAIEYGSWQEMCLDSLDGKLYCTSEEDSSLYAIDAEQGMILRRLKLSGEPCAMCFDYRDRKLYLGLGWDTVRIAVLDARADSLIKVIPIVEEYPTSIYELCYSPDKNWVYCAQWGTTAVVDCLRDTVVKTIGTAQLPSVFYSPITRRLYSSAMASVAPHTLWVYDEVADSVWEVPEVDRPWEIQSDGKSRLFVSGPSRIYVLRDE